MKEELEPRSEVDMCAYVLSSHTQLDFLPPIRVTKYSAKETRKCARDEGRGVALSFKGGCIIGSTRIVQVNKKIKCNIGIA